MKMLKIHTYKRISPKISTQREEGSLPPVHAPHQPTNPNFLLLQKSNIYFLPITTSIHSIITKLISFFHFSSSES